MQDLFLAQILSSRICHDLIAPIGAIKAGLELMKDEKTNDYTLDNQVLELIEKSTESAARRLSFYRFTFGFGAANSLSSMTQLRKILEEYLEPNQHKLLWGIPEDFLKENPNLNLWARLITGLSMWGVEASPNGGQISFYFDSQQELTLLLEGPLIIVQEAILKTLQKGVILKEITPQIIPAYLCYRWLKELGKKISIEVKNQNSVLLKIMAKGLL